MAGGSSGWASRIAAAGSLGVVEASECAEQLRRLDAGRGAERRKAGHVSGNGGGIIGVATRRQLASKADLEIGAGGRRVNCFAKKTDATGSITAGARQAGQTFQGQDMMGMSRQDLLQQCLGLILSTGRNERGGCSRDVIGVGLVHRVQHLMSIPRACFARDEGRLAPRRSCSERVQGVFRCERATRRRATRMCIRREQ